MLSAATVIVLTSACNKSSPRQSDPAPTATPSVQALEKPSPRGDLNRFCSDDLRPFAYYAPTAPAGCQALKRPYLHYDQKRNLAVNDEGLPELDDPDDDAAPADLLGPYSEPATEQARRNKPRGTTFTVKFKSEEGFWCCPTPSSASVGPRLRAGCPEECEQGHDKCAAGCRHPSLLEPVPGTATCTPNGDGGCVEADKNARCRTTCFDNVLNCARGCFGASSPAPPAMSTTAH